MKLVENAPHYSRFSPEGLMTITKADLATLLHENLGVNKREAAEIVMSFFDEISAELEQGETVKLSGFGVFCLRNKNSRPGRNQIGRASCRERGENTVGGGAVDRKGTKKQRCAR